MQAIKIVIIGAGSASFGLNSLGSLLREPSLRGSTLALVDLNPDGLALVHRLADRINREWDAGLTIESHTDRRAVLAGADFVVSSIEVGPREELWRQDWELSLRHGVRQPYAENGGPGGFAHAARNIPHVLDIARDMERLCPAAPLLMLSNPLPRLCRAVARYTSIRPIGLCHQGIVGAGMIALLLADRLGIHVGDRFEREAWPDLVYWSAYHEAGVADKLDVKAAGLNHFTWALDVRDRRTGEDLYPELRRRVLGPAGDREPLTRDLLRLTGSLPIAGDSHLSEYLPYTHNPATRPWERYGLRLYHWDRNVRRRDERWQLIARLGAEGGPELEHLRRVYSEGVFEVIHGLAHNANLYLSAINVPNEGAIGNLPPDAIVEAPALATGLGVQPLRIGPLPPLVAALCRREAELVEFVVEAAAQGSRELALQALALDPVVDDLDLAGRILDDMLATQREQLPQFHGRWSL